jgi:hypothetical protein
MIERPTTLEIENIITRIENIRAKWHGNPGYARSLDIELHALKLLLFTTRIIEEEAHIAATLGRAGETADG